MSEPPYRSVELPDGRELEVLRSGPADPTGTLVFHSGTPSGAVPFPLVSDAAQRLGLQTISWSRPGYGRSTEHAGRSVAQLAEDGRAVLDAMSVGDYVALGWSGGGPHALAHVALDPHCLAAATIGGVAPYRAQGLDWLGGMGEENLVEFAAAAAGIEPLTEFLTTSADLGLATVTAEGVAASLGDLLDAVDRDATHGAVAEFLAAGMRRALLVGMAGWRDDDLAIMADWGFDPGAITRPVTVWQGAHDRMVPATHGDWLAAAIPGARLRAEPAEGHLSLIWQVEEILADLLRNAG